MCGRIDNKSNIRYILNDNAYLLCTMKLALIIALSLFGLMRFSDWATADISATGGSVEKVEDIEPYQVEIEPRGSVSGSDSSGMLVDLSTNQLTVGGQVFPISHGAINSPTPTGQYILKPAVSGHSMNLPESSYVIEFLRMPSTQLPDSHPYSTRKGIVVYAIHEGGLDRQSMGCLLVTPSDLRQIMQLYTPGDTITIR